MKQLKAPFPYFGGKSKAATLIWEHLGNTPNYIEPFCGSAAVLLARPHAPKTETVNDMDGLLVNFWRAMKHDPDGVALHADYPVTELDMLARRDWLLREGPRIREGLRCDPDWFDVRAAGWWVWGINIWIGSGWGESASDQLPHLGNAGTGVHKKLPHLGDAGKGVLTGQHLKGWFHALSERLRRVRITNGSWERVLTPSVTTKHGITSVFLDPPYEHSPDVYATKRACSTEVREWCKENGSNPDFRIALCGYASEHDELLALGWLKREWKARKGYQKTDEDGSHTGHLEAVWFSPHCLKPSGLFEAT